MDDPTKGKTNDFDTGVKMGLQIAIKAIEWQIKEGIAPEKIKNLMQIQVDFLQEE